MSSNNNDTRVIEMRFDNKEFEANAKQTINTLQELKRAIDTNLSGNAFDELDRAARSIDLSGIQSGIDTLTDRFSTLGIVGMRVIENITDGLMNKLNGALGSVFNSIIEGGKRRAANIENARFQLQGMLDTESEVEEVMKNASDAVDGTAFSLDAAANAASQFAASGVQAGDQMTQALKGISGVAATTNSSFEDISRVFTTVAGNGRLMGDQLLQLSVRGLNAAASLKDYFNGVRNGSIEASDAVKEMITSLVGASEAIESSGEDQYESTAKSMSKEYDIKKKTYDAEYKSLQKLLNSEYNTKKSSYDKQYKALSDALNAELAAVQKSNSKRIDELNSAYQTDVDAYRKATNEKIKLINDEYTESIKLIDEERYNRIKAIDDQINDIRKLQETEEKERELAEENEQRKYLQQQIDDAKFAYTRKKAEEALAAFEKQVAEKRLREQRQNKINELNEEKGKINDEAALKKQEAAEKRSSAIDAVQEESNAKLQAMAKAHQAEMEAIREQQQAQVDAMREANAERLANLKAQQTAELEILKEGQQAQLEAKREANSIALSDFKELQNEQLLALKEALNAGGDAASRFGELTEITEQDIREMVSKGLISFDLFSEAMATTFGDHAKDANKTFTGALSNVRSALARTGAMFYTPFLEQGNPMIDFLNAIRVKVNEFNKSLAPFAKVVTNWALSIIPQLTDWVDKLNFSLTETIVTNDGIVKTVEGASRIGRIVSKVLQSIVNILEAIGSYIKPIIEAFREVFELDFKAIDEGATSLKDFTAGLKASDDVANGIKTTFKGVFSIFKLLGVVLKSVFQIFSPITKLFGISAESVTGLGSGIGYTVEAFTEWISTSQTLKDIISTLTGFVSIFVDKISALSKAVKNAFMNSFGGFNIGKYFTDGFINGMQKMIPDAIACVIDFGKAILNGIKKVLGIHSPSTEFYDIAKMSIIGFMNGLYTFAKDAINVVIEVSKDILNAVIDFVKGIDFESIFSNIIDEVIRLTNNIAEKIEDGIPIAVDAIANLFSNIKEAMSKDKTGEEGGENFIIAFIRGMKNAIVNGAKRFAEIITVLLNAIANKLKDFSIKDAFESGKEIANNVGSAIVTTLGEWMVPVSNIIKALFDNAGSVIAAGGGIAILWSLYRISKAFRDLANPFSVFNGALSGLKKALLGLSTSFKASAALKFSLALSVFIATLVGSISYLYNTLGDKPMDYVKLFAIVALIKSVILVFGTIIAALMLLMSKIENASNMYNKLASGARSLMKMEAFKSLFLGLSEVLKTILLSLVVLTVLYNRYPNELEQATKLFSVIAGCITGIMIVYSMLSSLMDEGAANFKSSAIGFLSLAAALYLIVLAIDKITKVKIDLNNKEQLITIAVVLGAVLVVVGMLALITRALNSEKGYLSGGLILGFCVLLWATLNAINKLIKMEASISKNWKQLLMIAAIFGMLIIVVYALKKVAETTSSQNVLKIGGSIFGICAFLIVAIAAIGVLSFMPLKRYAKGLLMLLGLFGSLYLAVKVGKRISSDKNYKSILALAATIATLVVGLAVLTTIDKFKLLSAALALAMVLSTLGEALSGAGKIKDSKGFFSILLMIAATGVIAYELWKLQEIPWKTLLSTGTAIGEVLAALALSLRVISDNKATWKAVMATFGYLVIGVAAAGGIAFILQTFSKNIKWDEVLSLATAMSELFGALALSLRAISDNSTTWKAVLSTAGYLFGGIIASYALAYILQKFSKDVTWDEVMALATGMSELFGALALSLIVISDNETTWKAVATSGVSLLEGVVIAFLVALILSHFSKDIDVDGIKGLATGISIVIIALSIAMRIITRNSTNWKAVGTNIGVLSEGLGAVAALIQLFRNVKINDDPANLIGLATSISIVLIGIAVCAAIANVVGAAAKEALIAILVLDAFVWNLAGCVDALGALYMDEGVKNAIANGGEFLIALGKAIGGFVGGLIAGGLDVITSEWPEYGTRLSSFMENAKDFFDGIRSITPEMKENALAMSSVVAALTSKDMTSGLYLLAGPKGILMLMINIISDKLRGTFAERLREFGEGLYAFADSTKNISDINHLSKVVDVFSTLAEVMNKIPNTGGIKQWFTGIKDIGRFGGALGEFSSYIGNIAKNFNDVPDEQLDKFERISKAMGYILNMNIPDTKQSAKSIIMGFSNIGTYGERLQTFSTYIPIIAKNFSDITNNELDKFEKIAYAIGCMCNIPVPNEGGLLSWLIGDNSISEYGEELVNFSKSMVTLTTLGLNAERTLKSLSNIEQVIPKVKDVYNLLKLKFGEYSGIDIAMQSHLQTIYDFSNTLKILVNSTKYIELLDLNHIELLIIKLYNIENKITQYFKDYNGGKFNKFLKDLKGFAKNLTEALINSNSISSNALKQFEDSIPIMYKLKNMFVSIGNGYDSKSWKNFKKDFEKYAEVIVTITSIDEDKFNNIKRLSDCTPYIETIAKMLKEKFVKFNSGYFSYFKSALMDYKDAIDKLSRTNFTVDLSKVESLAKSVVYMDDFINALSKVTNVNTDSTWLDWTVFNSNLTGYVNAIKKCSDASYATEVLGKIAVVTGMFMDLIPKFASFNADNFTAFIGKLTKTGEEALKGFLDTFRNSRESVSEAIAKLFSFINTSITNSKELMEACGRTITYYLCNGISENKSKSKILTAMNDVKNAIEEGIKSIYYKMEIAGINTVIGYINGIYKIINEHSVYDAGKSIGESALEGLRKALDTNSPSKKAIKIGGYTGEGFIDGLLEWVSAASKSGAEIGEKTLESLQSALSKVSEEIQNDDDFMPVITPVLDLSNVEANASRIGGLLDLNKTIQLSSSAGLSFAGGLNNLLNNIQASIPDNTNDDVVEAINGLRSDMTVMNERINNLQIVMDSGELVGAIINPIDEQLGFNATLVERGVR